MLIVRYYFKIHEFQKVLEMKIWIFVSFRILYTCQ